MASGLAEVKSELNQTKTDLESELSQVAVSHLNAEGTWINFKENLNGTATFPATCQEYFDRGTRFNGTYKIRPSLEIHSFYVECEFTEDIGITVIRQNDWKSDGYHYPQNDSQRCQNADCFTKSIEYGISLDQIEVRWSFFEP